MADQSEFKLRVHVDKLLYVIVIIAEWQHLVDQELEGKVARWLLEIRFNLVLSRAGGLVAVLGSAITGASPRGSHLASLDIHALDRGHCEKQVLNKERFLDIDRELAQILSLLLLLLASRWILKLLDEACIL